MSLTQTCISMKCVGGGGPNVRLKYFKIILKAQNQKKRKIKKLHYMFSPEEIY
jgi:hypothetical protein